MDEGRLFDPTPTLTVGEVNRRLGAVVERAFGDEIWVQGEISGLAQHRRPDTNLFFDLVEPGPGDRPSSRLRVALFAERRRGVNALLRRAGGVRMQDGLHVRIRGSIAFFRRQGSIQLRMSAIDPEHTLGRMAVSRERVLAALAAEGLLDRNGTLALSPAPLRIGLVTSAGSAACQDFLHELERSGLAWSVRLVDTRVQGREAETAVAGALTVASRAVDVVALVRGGGARTDLATFDSDEIARAIAELDVPVVTGIGHEIDRSVADEVVHTARKTPTAAATFLVERSRTWLESAETTWRSIIDAGRRTVATVDGSLVRHGDRARRLVTGSLDRADGQLTTAVDVLAGRAGTALGREDRRWRSSAAEVRTTAPRVLKACERELDGRARAVTALDPRRVLERGYSITRTADGALVRRAEDVGVDDRLLTTLSAGALTSHVEETSR